MSPSPPSEDSNLLPADLDLSQIFIGREQQLDLFQMYLGRWKTHMPTAPEVLMTTAPSPNSKVQGPVVLLYGRGGFGKSTLLRHYRDIVLADSQQFIVGEIVDWEFAIEGKRSVFNPAPGQEVDAAEYFRLLCSKLVYALKKQADDFKEYQAAVKAVEEAKKQACNITGVAGVAGVADLSVSSHRVEPLQRLRRCRDIRVHLSFSTLSSGRTSAT